MPDHVLSITPLRVSLFGGGTDFPEYYEQEGKRCNIISFASTYRTYLFMKRVNSAFDFRYRVAWRAEELSLYREQILHPFVKAALSMSRLEMDSLEVGYHSDFPSRSGLGSSASFAVGLINGIISLKEASIDDSEVVNLAFHIERNLLGQFCGIQDQIACQLGGFNHVEIDGSGFSSSSTFCEDALKQLILSRSWLIPVSQGRSAAMIEESKFQDLSNANQKLDSIASICLEALKYFNKSNYPAIAELVSQSWQEKRRLSDKVSNSNIDTIIEICSRHGADGAKLLGAGGGGFIYLLASAEAKNRIRPILQEAGVLPDGEIYPVDLCLAGNNIIEV